MKPAQRPALDFGDFGQARAFLAVLGGGESRFTFQTFPDRKPGDPPPKRDDPRARILFGTLDEHLQTLIELNRQGAGVFVAVNPQRGSWRSNTDTIFGRAIWHENDGVLSDSVSHHWPITPTMVVHTRPDHTHTYWVLKRNPEWSDRDWLHWEGIARHMIEHRQSDPRSSKRSQVLRVPCFYHMKDPAKISLVRLTRVSPEHTYTLDELSKVFPPVTPQRTVEPATRIELDNEGLADLPTVTELEWRDVCAMLDYISPDAATMPVGDGNGTRDRWLRVLMALEDTKHPDRRNVADEWSRCGGLRDSLFQPPRNLRQWPMYVEGEVEYQMGSFKRATGNKIGLGTIIRLARLGGWPGWKYSLRQREDSIEDLILPPEDPQRPFFIHTPGNKALSLIPPTQDFLLDKFLSGDSTLSAIAGRGGVGKSKLVNGIAAAVAAGKPAFGYPPLMPHIVGSVVVVDLENDQHEFTRRFQDTVRAMVEHEQLGKAEAADVMQRVRHIYVDRMLYPLAVQSMGAPVRHGSNWSRLYDELCKVRDEQAGIGGVRWVCFDALYKFHACSENDPAHMMFVLEQLNELVSSVFGSIPRTILHHSSKAEQGTGYFDSGGGTLRGSSAIEAAVRSVAMVRTLTLAESERLKIAEADRRSYAVCVVMKSNYAVMQPDNFLLRSFGGAWWYSDRGEQLYEIAQKAQSEGSPEFAAFLGKLYDYIVIGGKMLAVSHFRAMWKEFGINRQKMDEYLMLARAAGYIQRHPKLSYLMWTGTDSFRSDNSFESLAP